MTKDKVLFYLREQEGYVSGQKISEKLGLSRMAVSTAVSALREAGYAIESSPRRGYRLVSSPDKLTSGELMSHLSEDRLNRVVCLEKTDSTNHYLKMLADRGAPVGQVVIANEQTAGRGRRGRTFVSLKDKGIYLSILLRPESRPADTAVITAWTAVAICDAIEEVCLFRPDIKWVNDLQFDGRKITGILTEMSLEGESGLISSVIIGIGINVNQTPEDFPEELRDTAGSLAMAVGHPLSRAALAAAMIRSLDRLTACWPIAKERYLEAYRRGCRTPGQAVNVITGAGSRPAEALAVNDDFSLRVRYEDGTVEDLQSGEVSIRPVK